MKQLLENSKRLAFELTVFVGLFLFGYLLTSNAYAIGKYAQHAYPQYGPSLKGWFIWTILGRVSVGFIAMLISSGLIGALAVVLWSVTSKALKNPWQKNMPK